MAKRKSKKRKNQKKKVYSIFIYLAIIVIVAIAAYFLYENGYLVFEIEEGSSTSYQESSSNVSSSSSDNEASLNIDVDVVKSNDISFHFMELGNKYTGDSTLVKAGECEVLIDAGSKVDSINTLTSYISNYLEGDIEYLVITHAHEDHYAGYTTSNYDDSMFAKLNVNENTTIIDFAQITKGKESQKMYQRYQANLKIAIENGAKHYTCKELVDNGNTTFNLSENVSMEILNTKFYHEVSSSENNHSVCTLFTCGKLNYLLTGDLEEDGEKSLISLNDLPEVELYKAGHHGSKTSSSSELMEVIKPKIVTVCCCAGSSEYTDVNENQFPTQKFVDNVTPYTDKVYVTSLCLDYKENRFTSFNGNIVVYANVDSNEANVSCSYSNTKLKDSEWFKNNRT